MRKSVRIYLAKIDATKDDCKMKIERLINRQYLPYSRTEFRMHDYVKSFDAFLNESIAEACYRDLVDNVEFAEHKYGTLTEMQIALRPTGKVYTGELSRKVKTDDSDILDSILKMFEAKWFIDFLSFVVGEELRFNRPATPYRFQKDNYLCLHDDMSDPHHAYEVVINLTKDWLSCDGGFAYGGYVAKRSIAPTPEHLPFLLQKLSLDKSRPHYRVMPVFNRLTVLKLSDNLCHGTTLVKADKTRTVIAAIYSGSTPRITTTLWR